MENQKHKDMAAWAADALSRTTIQGVQARNLIAVQEWLADIANGKLKVESALNENAGASV